MLFSFLLRFICWNWNPIAGWNRWVDPSYQEKMFRIHSNVRMFLVKWIEWNGMVILLVLRSLRSLNSLEIRHFCMSIIHSYECSTRPKHLTHFSYSTYHSVAVIYIIFFTGTFHVGWFICRKFKNVKCLKSRQIINYHCLCSVVSISFMAKT